MATFVWKLHDATGLDIGTSEGFTSREDAEAWLGQHWARLRADGVDAVSLVGDDEILYRMSLQEA